MRPVKRTPQLVEYDVKVNILLSGDENPTSSARRNKTNFTTALRRLHIEKLHICKLTFVQNPNQRMYFCEKIMKTLNRMR